jgi:hypothetical protein
MRPWTAGGVVSHCALQIEVTRFLPDPSARAESRGGSRVVILGALDGSEQRYLRIKNSHDLCDRPCGQIECGWPTCVRISTVAKYTITESTLRVVKQYVLGTIDLD